MAQTEPMDSTGRFVLGLYAIWSAPQDSVNTVIDPPLHHCGCNWQGYWDKERENYAAIGANYIMAYVPRHIEEKLAETVAPLGYRMDFGWPPCWPAGWPEDMRVRLAVYSLLGREIAVLADGEQKAGAHAVQFSAPSDLANGTYYYVLSSATGRAGGLMHLER